MTVLAFPSAESNPTATPPKALSVSPSFFVVPRTPLTAEGIKAAFRRRAAERGINPERGSTAYEAANLQAELSKRSHHARMRARVHENAKLRGPDATRSEWAWVGAAVACRPPVARLNGIGAADETAAPLCYRWQLVEVRYTHWDNGAGAVDSAKVESRARRDWWAFSHLWRYGPAKRATFVLRPTPYAKIELNGQMLQPTEVDACRRLFQQGLAIEAERHHTVIARFWNGLGAKQAEKEFRAMVRAALQDDRRAA